MARAIWELLRCWLGAHPFDEYGRGKLLGGGELIAEQCIVCRVTRTSTHLPKRKPRKP